MHETAGQPAPAGLRQRRDPVDAAVVVDVECRDDGRRLAVQTGAIEAQEALGRPAHPAREGAVLVAVGAIVDRADLVERSLGVPVEVARVGLGHVVEVEDHCERRRVEPVAGVLEHPRRVAVGLRHPDRPRLDPGLVVGGGELVERRGERVVALVEHGVEDRALGHRRVDRGEDPDRLEHTAAVDRGRAGRERRREGLVHAAVPAGVGVGLSHSNAALPRAACAVGDSRLSARVTPSAIASIATSTRSSDAMRSLSAAIAVALSSSGSGPGRGPPRARCRSRSGRPVAGGSGIPRSTRSNCPCRRR